MAAGSELVKWTVPVYPEVRFPKASSAVTVNECEVPAVTGEGYPATASFAVAAALTVIPVCEPDVTPLADAVMDCVPAVFSVPLNW